jgi:hypothetical protein
MGLLLLLAFAMGPPPGPEPVRVEDLARWPFSEMLCWDQKSQCEEHKAFLEKQREVFPYDRRFDEWIAQCERAAGFWGQLAWVKENEERYSPEFALRQLGGLRDLIGQEAYDEGRTPALFPPREG